jgi:hypothetical protein
MTNLLQDASGRLPGPLEGRCSTINDDHLPGAPQ